MKKKLLIIAAAAAVLIPLGASALNTPSINTPAQWTPNYASTTITPNPNNLRVPCANIVGGCGGGSGSVGPSTSTFVAVFNGSSTITGSSSLKVVSGVVLAQNMESVVFADQWPGANIGAQINNAYAACPSNGCEIVVPHGTSGSNTWDYNTDIVIGTNSKVVQLYCPVGGGFFNNAGTVLHYTGSGTAFSNDTNNFVVGGEGITNCSFVGPAGTDNIGSSTIASSFGVKLGGSFGAFGFHLDNVHISGFGTGLYIGQNVSFLNITNSVINKNGRNIDSPQVSGANGENMRVTNSVIADSNNGSGSSIADFCIDVQLSGNVQWTFQGTSFDDCSVYSNQFGGTANLWNFTDDHWENPNLAVAPYAYVQTQPTAAAAAATVIDIKGGDMMQDLTSGAPNEFIKYGGSLILDGVTGDVNNNVNNPMAAFATPLNNTAVISWTGLQQKSVNTGTATAVTNVYGSQAFSTDGVAFGSSTAVFSFSTSTAAFGSPVTMSQSLTVGTTLSVPTLLVNAANSTISQNATGTAILGNLVQNGGVTTVNTTTTLSGTQFCVGGLFNVQNTTGSVTITLPTTSTIAGSVCGSGIYTGGFAQQFLTNNSTNTVFAATNGAGETQIYSPGTPTSLAPGQEWFIQGQFENTSTLQGATSTGTNLVVKYTLYQTSTPFTVSGNTSTFSGNVNFSNLTINKFLALDPSGYVVTTSTPTASSSVTFLFNYPSTSTPAFLDVKTPTAKTISSVDCWENSAATTTILLYYNTTLASSGIQQVMLSSIACGINGTSTTSFSTTTLPINSYLFAIVSSTVGSPTLTTLNVTAIKN